MGPILDYTVYAWVNTEEGTWLPFCTKYDGLGKPVHVSAGITQTIDLRVPGTLVMRCVPVRARPMKAGMS